MGRAVLKGAPETWLGRVPVGRVLGQGLQRGPRVRENGQIHANSDPMVGKGLLYD